MRAIRAGLCVLVTYSVLAFGGVMERAQAIVEVGAAGLLLLRGWKALRDRQTEVSLNMLLAPLCGLLGIGSAQLFFGLSAYRYGTKVEILHWSAAVLLFFLAVESLRTVEDAMVFAWFLVVLGFSVSLFGIVQHFTFNGKLYWFVPMEAGGGAFGPFVDRDHFAGFVELTVPLGLALLFFRACRREHIMILGFASIVPIGALVLSASRGGILSFLAEFILLVCFWSKCNARTKPFFRAALLTVVAGAFAFWLGSSDTVQRFQDLELNKLVNDQRLSMDNDTLRIFLRHAWMGTGLGTLRIVYPQYESNYNQPGIDHAHNDYLELLAEEGILGGLCGAGFLAALFWKGFVLMRSAESCAQQALRAGSLAGCAGLLVHSLVDFNFHIPSNALLFLLLGAIATTKMEDSR